MVELFSSPRSQKQLAAIRARVEKLEEDQAIFVAIAPAISNNEVRFEVLSLRRSLRIDLVGFPIAVLEDFDKSGVWLYKQARIPGAGRGISPLKEAEIKNRQIGGTDSNAAGQPQP